MNTRRVVNVNEATRKVLMYLADLELAYSPVDIAPDGRFIGGDEKLYWFVKKLSEAIRGLAVDEKGK